MEKSFSWKCPYCKTQTTIIIASNADADIHYYGSSSKFGAIGLRTQYIVCPNPECKELIINAQLMDAILDPSVLGYRLKTEEPILSWNLKPQSSAMPQPDYIPEQIRNDYYEACSILSLSPKASATLSRRCLQGMMRDFWGITKNRLIDEIDELKNQNQVAPSTIDSLDAIRQIGNIGAHMEKDVNLIIDIDEDEANILIKLLEDLFQDWYIVRHEREERNKNILTLAASKQAAKKGTP
jgi:hypothetical protein